ncbi:MAG: FecR domain-containing protein [Spirochaetia bacterium]|nr:FecR domain-containing protein [Spirochaetia bacterium]
MSEMNHHEDLARRILDTPPSAWPGELGALRVETTPMPADLRAKLKAMSKAPAPQTTSVPAASNVRPFMLRRAPALAAAASLLIVFGTGLYIYLARPFGTSGSAVVAFAEGRVDSGERHLVAGDRLKEGGTLSTAGNSLAVITIEQGRMESMFRVRPESELRLETLAADATIAKLVSGNLLVQFNPRKGQEHQTAGVTQNRILSIRSGNAEATVIGTEFSLEVSKQGDARLTTYSGSVAFRRRWASLEDLPDALLSQSRFLTDARDILAKAGASVPPDHQSVIGQADFNDRLSRVSQLEKALNHPALVLLRSQPKPQKEDVQAALDVLAQAFPTDQDKTKALEGMRAAFGQAPQVTKIDSETSQELKRLLESPGEKERAVRYEQLKSAARTMDKETFTREAAKALGKAPQEIVLKNGETIYGSLFGENGLYKVYTATGVRTVNPDEIEEIRF